MVNISKIGDSTIKFTFTDNDRYLYNGEIVLPLNSLILEFDSSDLVIFKKIDGDVFVTFLLENSNFNSKAELESWFKANAVGSTGGGGGITSGEVQTMIDSSISGKTNQSDFTAFTASTDTALAGKLDATAYTPVQVSSAITENDTNAVAGGAVYDKVHITSGNGSTTVLTFDGNGTATNYPSGNTKVRLYANANGDIEVKFLTSNKCFYWRANYNSGEWIFDASLSSLYCDGPSFTATTSYTDNVLTVEVTNVSTGVPSDIIGLEFWDGFVPSQLAKMEAVQGESVEYWIKDYVDAKVAELLNQINNS